MVDRKFIRQGDFEASRSAASLSMAKSAFSLVFRFFLFLECFTDEFGAADKLGDADHFAVPDIFGIVGVVGNHEIIGAIGTLLVVDFLNPWVAFTVFLLTADPTCLVFHPQYLHEICKKFERFGILTPFTLSIFLLLSSGLQLDSILLFFLRLRLGFILKVQLLAVKTVPQCSHKFPSKFSGEVKLSGPFEFVNHCIVIILDNSGHFSRYVFATVTRKSNLLETILTQQHSSSYVMWYSGSWKREELGGPGN